MGFIQYLKEEHRKGFDNYKVWIFMWDAATEKKMPAWQF